MLKAICGLSKTITAQPSCDYCCIVVWKFAFGLHIMLSKATQFIAFSSTISLIALSCVTGTTTAEDLVPTLLGMYDALIGRTAPSVARPPPPAPPAKPTPVSSYRPLSVISVASSSSSSSSSGEYLLYINKYRINVEIGRGCPLELKGTLPPRPCRINLPDP